MAHTPDDIYELREQYPNLRYTIKWWKDGWPQRFEPDSDYAMYVELGTRVTGAMLIPPPVPWAYERR